MLTNHANLSVDDLWDIPSPEESIFHLEALADLPPAARLYLTHAIAPGTRLASAVRLRMHGEIKLHRWLPFTAEQVICRNQGMIWTAAVRWNGVPIYGWDRFIDGAGSMQWKILGLLPVMKASGADVTRSTIGRIQAETVWLPSALCDPTVEWTETGTCHAHAAFTISGETAHLDLTLDPEGRVNALTMPRWGNPDGKEPFHYVAFGGTVEEEKTFDGYTIPTTLRVGWYFGSDRFEPEGEFFRAVIDDAEFR